MTRSKIKDGFVPTTILDNFTEITLLVGEQKERSLREIFPGEIG
jgi:hypothetical protein